MKVGLPDFKVESLGSNRYNRGVKQYDDAGREVVSSEAHLTNGKPGPDGLDWKRRDRYKCTISCVYNDPSSAQWKGLEGMTRQVSFNGGVSKGVFRFGPAGRLLSHFNALSPQTHCPSSACSRETPNSCEALESRANRLAARLPSEPTKGSGTRRLQEEPGRAATLKEEQAREPDWRRRRGLGLLFFFFFSLFFLLEFTTASLGLLPPVPASSVQAVC